MVLNSLLIVLIFKNRSASSDKSYKPILLQICITDMLTLILFTFYMPAFVGAGPLGYTLGFFNDLFENAPMFTHIVFTSWYFFMYLFVVSPAAQFLYRYLVLCRGWKPSYRLYTALYSVIILLIMYYSIQTNNGTIYVSRTSNAPYRDYIFTDNPTNVDLLVFSRGSSPTPPSALSMIVSMSVSMLIVAIPSSVVVVCGIRICLHLRRHLKTISASNINNQRLQRQVNYVLFIQGGMPIAAHLVSMLLIIFSDQKAEYMSFLPHFVTLLIIVLNPLLTLLLVDSYRRAALNLFWRIPASANVSTSVVQAIKISRLSIVRNIY
ncbi:serpentine type 7TM GPCR chemoreceptor str domain-containing protein [Ditylenchus destructor]|uniref:Serpentine type 7TM GPCR chemoreceptor str domain-containing protein n=1 Tax=Ditylenchus destructor TaxID=166010 RepID=A0AAD4MU98_9BILA|nr:serpentine type 7TM GPCR chemoreceptor str domain-containing protein [Ditylenchus destructor]